MNNQADMMLIPKIEEGIVIDHIPAGLGMKVLGLLTRFPEIRNTAVTIGFNYNSTRMGRKDIIKCQSPQLSQKLLQLISIVSPDVTIKRITNFKVDKKFVNKVPDIINNLVRCRNPNCITNHSDFLPTTFTCVESKQLAFKCRHCEKIFALNELELNIYQQR